MQKNLYREVHQLQQMYNEYSKHGEQDALSAYAVFDESMGDYAVKITHNETHHKNVFCTIYALRPQRVKIARPVSLVAAKNLIRKIGFKSFIVLLEGDDNYNFASN